jgi:hypothetical protein
MGFEAEHFGSILFGDQAETFTERVDVSPTPDGTVLKSEQITTVTPEGAVGALAAELRDLRAENEDLRAENAALRAQLAD